MLTKRAKLLAINGLGIAAATAFAARGAVSPAFSTPGLQPIARQRFWSLASAVRTVSLGVVLTRSALREPSASSELLAVAGLVQLGDAGLGLWQRDPAMTLLPMTMGVVHLRSAHLLRSQGDTSAR